VMTGNVIACQHVRISLISDVANLE
jgi:hypothetical protein